MYIDEIIQSIQQYETIIIHRHVRPDPDAYGSQVGLKEVLKETYPEKEIYAVGYEDSSLHFLTRMDVIKDEKYRGALVIVCDTANTARICDERYKLGEKLIKIDHHPNNDNYGDVKWVDTTASSTSELIYEFYLRGKEKGIKMNDAAARLIYAGIVGDTGRFLFPSTTKKTFEYAADLVTYDFNRQALYEGIYNVTDNVARMRGYVLQNYKVSKAGLSTVRLTEEILEEYNMEALETGQLVGVLGEIEGIKAWAFFIEEGDDVIRVRIRSKGPVINSIATRYNGGGHPLAAGATVYTWKDAEKVTKELEEACARYEA